MKLLFTLIVIILFQGCRLFNPDEQEPSFILIDDFNVVTTSDQGSASHAVTEVWVYANGNIMGIYDVPAQVPVLYEGNTNITAYAGIKNNGISTTRIRYPFYIGADSVFNLQPLQSYQFSPVFSYPANAEIDNSRNFEVNNFFVEGPSNLGNLDIINDPDIAVNGNKCAMATLASGDNYMHFIDDINLTMQAGNTIFLEMDYSCNNTFSFGVYVIEDGNTEKYPVIYITPTTSESGLNPEWNKIYLDFGAVVSAYPNADSFRIFFECVASESTTPTIFFDNLKVVNW